MRIAVYGASGYTGRLVVAELVRRGIDVLLVGRDTDRLRSAAVEAGAPEAEVRAAGLDDPVALADALHGSDGVISCVAPFARHGEAVLRAAIASGCHYVDISGEQPFTKHVYDTFGAEAERAGITVVSAATDDAVPVDLVAHLAAQEVAPVDTIVVAHRWVDAGMSRGSLNSMVANLAAFATGGLSYVDGEWRAGVDGAPTSLVFPGDSAPVAVTGLAAPELPGIPRHVPARVVTAVIEQEFLAQLGGIATPEVIATVPEGPSVEDRGAARFVLVADAVGVDGQRARGVVTGTDLYGSTAVIAVESIRRLVTDGAKPGVLAPAEAFDPVDFLEFLAGHGVNWFVD